MNTTLDKKWLELENEVERRGGDGKELVAAMKELYELWTPDLYRWVARLWSREEGGFYYSNSARDNEPFLPDIESTLQALGIICRSGMVDYSELPEDMKDGTKARARQRSFFFAVILVFKLHKLPFLKIFSYRCCAAENTGKHTDTDKCNCKIKGIIQKFNLCGTSETGKHCGE